MEKKIKKSDGFTLVEALVALAIFLVVSIGIYGVLATGRSTWFDTDASIELQQNLRLALEKLSRELHESGFDKNNAWQISINNGGGVNGTDILKFSIPIICHSGDSVIDANGDIAYWGAPLTWGCTSSTCMDADDVCATRDYRYLEYYLDASNQLVRKVLDNNSVSVREDAIARNINNFQVTNSVDQNVITLQFNGQRKSAAGRTVTATANMDVYLRN